MIYCLVVRAVKSNLCYQIPHSGMLVSPHGCTKTQTIHNFSEKGKNLSHFSPGVSQIRACNFFLRLLGGSHFFWGSLAQSSSHWTHPEFLQHNVHGHQFPQFLLQSLFGTLVHQVLQKRINGLWCSFIKSLMDGAGAKVQLVGHSPCLKPNYVWSPAPHMFPKGPSRVTPKLSQE